MKAIGKNIDGKEIKISIYGDTFISCSNLNLTELKIPNGVETLYCDNNQLTELKIPNDVEYVECYNNPIKEITLPKSIGYAVLPLNCIVTNLDEFKNKDKVDIKFQ